MTIQILLGGRIRSMRSRDESGRPIGKGQLLAHLPNIFDPLCPPSLFTAMPVWPKWLDSHYALAVPKLTPQPTTPDEIAYAVFEVIRAMAAIPSSIGKSALSQLASSLSWTFPG